MLSNSLNNKFDLIKILQQITIRKIVGKDIENKDDMKSIIKTAEGLAQGNAKLTVLLITS